MALSLILRIRCFGVFQTVPWVGWGCLGGFGTLIAGIMQIVRLRFKLAAGMEKPGVGMEHHPRVSPQYGVH